MMRENAEERNMRQKTGACELEPALLYLIYGNEQETRFSLCLQSLHSTRLWEMDKDAKDVVTGK